MLFFSERNNMPNLFMQWSIHCVAVLRVQLLQGNDRPNIPCPSYTVQLVGVVASLFITIGGVDITRPPRAKAFSTGARELFFIGRAGSSPSSLISLPSLPFPSFSHRLPLEVGPTPFPFFPFLSLSPSPLLCHFLSSLFPYM